MIRRSHRFSAASVVHVVHAKLSLTAWLAVTGVLAVVTPAAHAAVVTFGTPTAISGPSDVSLNGTLVGAFNFDNGSTTTTVNGVTFTKVTYPGDPGPPYNQVGSNILLEESGGFGSGQVSGTTGNASYDLLLVSLAFETNAAGSLPFTFNGLTDGQSYEFQVWSAQGAVGTWSINQTRITAGANSVTLPSGTYVTGAFTADGATQSFSWEGFGTFGLINAIQLRAVETVPTPVALPTGLTLIGLIAARRRR